MLALRRRIRYTVTADTELIPFPSVPPEHWTLIKGITWQNLTAVRGTISLVDVSEGYEFLLYTLSPNILEQSLHPPREVLCSPASQLGIRTAGMTAGDELEIYIDALILTPEEAISHIISHPFVTVRGM